MCSSKLSLNIDKTESMLIGSRHMLSVNKSLNVRIAGKCIQSKEFVKYLGVFIDPELKWNSHIDKLCAKTSKLVNFLGRLRSFLNEDSLKLIYRSVILPLFDYADVIFDSSNLKYTQQLQKIQNRACRIILKISPYKYMSNHTVHQLLNWESLKSRRIKHTLSMVYKSLNGISAPYLHDIFQISSHKYSLRSDKNLSLPKPRTEYCRRMFSYRGTSYFNEMPRDAKCSVSYSSFNNVVNNHILNWV